MSVRRRGRKSDPFPDDPRSRRLPEAQTVWRPALALRRREVNHRLRWRFDLAGKRRRQRGAGEYVYTDRGLHGVLAAMLVLGPVLVVAALWLAETALLHGAGHHPAAVDPVEAAGLGGLAGAGGVWALARCRRGRRLRIDGGRVVLEELSIMGSSVTAEEPVEAVRVTIRTINVWNSVLSLLAVHPVAWPYEPTSMVALLVEGDGWVFVVRSRGLDVVRGDAGETRAWVKRGVPPPLERFGVRDETAPVLVGY